MAGLTGKERPWQNPPVRRRAGALMADREIALRCAMPEKFIEKACAEEINVMEARRSGDGVLLLRVRGRDAGRLVSLAQRYSLRIVSDRAVGRDIGRIIRGALPFAAGFLMCMALFLPLSGRIWRIDVRCYAGGEISGVHAAVEETKTEIGGTFPDCDMLSRQLESLCPGFAHISVKRDGVVLLVEAYRETDAPGLYDVKAARDLIAKYDAVVEKIVVLSGRAAVQPGDVVKKGQALILGEEKATDETTRGVRALGDVTGYIWVHAEEQAGLLQEISVPTGQERMRARLSLPGLTLPIRQADDFARQEKTQERIPVGGLLFPMHIERERLRETRTETVFADESALRAALEASAMAEAMSKLPENAQIIDKWTDYSMMEGDRLTVRVCLQASVPIAVSRSRPETDRDTP